MAKEKKVTHESLMQDISDAEKSLSDAKAAYKLFCKENPLSLNKQPTLHELRVQREKNNKSSEADHAKANKAAQASAQKAQLKQEITGA